FPEHITPPALTRPPVQHARLTYATSMKVPNCCLAVDRVFHFPPAKDRLRRDHLACARAPLECLRQWRGPFLLPECDRVRHSPLAESVPLDCHLDNKPGLQQPGAPWLAL